jgi:hypothetical protein
MQLFPFRLSSLFKRAGSDTWRQMSHFHYLSDDEITASVADGAQHLRACLIDDTTNVAVISIPATSIYSDSDQATRLIDMLTQHKLAPKAYRASGSEDIHIYLSFTEKVNSDVVNKLLTNLLDHSGFEIGVTTLIIHPSETALVLPLQKGFAWLNEQLQVKLCRDDITLDSALSLFLSDLSRSAVNFEQVAQSAEASVQAENDCTVKVNSETVTSFELPDCLISNNNLLESMVLDNADNEPISSLLAVEVPSNECDQALEVTQLIDYAKHQETDLVGFSDDALVEQIGQDDIDTSVATECLPVVEAEVDTSIDSAESIRPLETAGETSTEAITSDDDSYTDLAISVLKEVVSDIGASELEPPSETLATDTQLSLFPNLIAPQALASGELKKPKRPGRTIGSSSERSPPPDT